MKCDLYKKLTKRQLEIADCARRGFTDKQIANAFKISVFTVKAHLKNVYERMEVSGRTELAGLPDWHEINVGSSQEQLTERHGIDLSTVTLLRQRLQDLDALYDQVPSTSLLIEAGQCLNTISHLRDYISSSAVRRDLLAVEADAAILMGRLIWDASQRRDHVSARLYFARALKASQYIGRSNIEALAVLRICFVALYGEKNFREGLDLSRRAANLAMPTSNALAGLAILHAAEAYAMMNQPCDCDRALEQAQETLAAVTDDDVAAELYNSASYGRLAGSCYLSLKRYRQAEYILHTTSAEIVTTSKSRAIILGNLGLAQLGQRKVDEAAVSINQAIDVLEHSWGGGGLTVVFDATRRMRPWANFSAAIEVQDRLLSMIAAR
jgi:DNA-binding CsgD family transcriptional regulator